MSKKKKHEELKIVRAAAFAKSRGYTHIAAVIKTFFDTGYYNVQRVDDVIRRGWAPAEQAVTGWIGPIGVTAACCPVKTILRTELMRLFDTEVARGNEK